MSALVFWPLGAGRRVTSGYRTPERPDHHRTSQVAGGSDHRALMLRVDGSKDMLGPRRFSPALGWVEYGSGAA